VSDKKISDNAISDAAELLYKGAKMLTYHCPDCKLPLFEKDGKIFCPSCGKEAIFEKELEKEIQTEDKKTVLNGSLTKKIEIAAEKVCDLIISSNKIEDVKTLTETLERLVNVLNKLKKD